MISSREPEASEIPSAGVKVDAALSLAEARKIGVEELVRRYLRAVLVRNKGSVQKSAADAGISTRQLNKLMTKYGIRKEEFRG